MQMKKIPDYNGSSFNPEKLGNENVKPSHENAKKYEKAAELWNQVRHTASDIYFKVWKVSFAWCYAYVVQIKIEHLILNWNVKVREREQY